MRSNPSVQPVDPMHPHRGSFSLSTDKKNYPSFNENVYLLMRGFNAIKVHGSVTNAEIMLIWNLSRRYGTELWTGPDDDEVEDTLIFPFRENDGTITFEGKAMDPRKNWNAKLEFEFINLCQKEIDELNSDSS